MADEARVQVVDGVEEVIEWVKSSGYEVYTHLYKAATQPPVATAVMVHGIGEHTDRYEALARSFAKSGIQVLGFDQYGFGRTGHRSGQMGDNGGPQCVIDDIALANSIVSIPGIPHFLFGHSMGGLNVLRYCLERNSDSHVKGAVVSAPAISPAKALIPPKPVVFLLKQIAKIAPRVTKESGISSHVLTSNQEEIEKFKDSQYNISQSSLRTLDTIVSGGGEVAKRAAEFTTPLFLVHSEDDQVTDCTSTCKFYRDLPDSLDKELKEIKGCKYHEIHFEEDLGFDLFGTYQDWILQRAKAGPEN
ncbi:hypothetical protein GGI12_005596 [Dipsacomyces acuminosporus]|nr:hypothetical protein GGI12_005596 [Dipsacomyces acuminosporus]